MKPKNKIIFFSVFIAMIITVLNCKSTQEKAVENAATATNVCPELGRLDEKKIKPEAIYIDEATKEKLIAVSTKNLGKNT